jgi:tetratricopeptide (TPR) repeat protein
MNVSAVDVKTSASTPFIAIRSPFERQLFYILTAVALVYALLAGLHTVSDLDLGWQLATGRWVVQHHSVPSTDVLSYTAAGAPWTYPVGGSVFFYLMYQLGGYALLSWIGAAACAGTIALLLRRGTVLTAALAILAVPLVAMRTLPRADMFTVVLFAAFLSLLWEQHRTGRARLWLLPPLMLVWVNVHFGFAAGLMLMAAYVGAELLNALLDASNRRAALDRLRQAWLWLAATALVTLLNPFGWNVYRALLLQGRANQAQQFWISEWVPIPLNWVAFRSGFGLRPTQGAIYLLLAVAIVAAMIALLRAQLADAIMLVAAIHPAIKYARMGSIFACVVVVVAGPVLSRSIAGLAARIAQPHIRRMAAVAAVVLFTTLASVRAFDLVTDRHYLSGTEETNFGAGLGWWFPQHAADFVERENLPGNLFNTYNEGGYLAWRLGPTRLVYIDGRDTFYGVQRIQRHSQLLLSAPDSADWQQESSRYNINTIILPLGRVDGIQIVRLEDFCSSKLWQAVYLDEVSAVFVRRSPQTEDLIQRHAINCALAPLPAETPGNHRASAFNAWANAAGVLSALDRNQEALNATDKALAIYSDSAFMHWQRGNILSAMGRLDDSEQEYLTAVALQPSDVTWAALADNYLKRGRRDDAIEAMQHAADVSAKPYPLLQNLGYMYLRAHEPENALQALNRAASAAPKNIGAADNGSFDFMVAQGRSVAWEQLGDLPQAITFQEQSSQIKPNAPEAWQRLAKLYRKAKRDQDAARAEQQATSSKP